MTSTMEHIRTLAGIAYDSFERKERPNGDSIVVRKDDAPEWVADIVQDAHGEMFPDDWRYETIRAAFGAIHDSWTDYEDEMADAFADDADVYNADLIKWVGSHDTRAGYVDEAVEEYSAPRDFYHGLQMGQYAERREVFERVFEGLRAVKLDPGITADDFRELRKAAESESLSYGELALIESAFDAVPDSALSDQRENATADDMLDEIAAAFFPEMTAEAVQS